MDRYRVDKVVGKGSFGQAILCSRIADGKACIVKQVDTSKLPSKARREASKEATLLAKLSHPNIVGFWESFFDGPSRDVLCIVMDYADGGDLSSCLRRRNGRLLDEEVVLDWFVQTTLALKHIHDRKILHRDLKTQNIFLTRSRIVKLGDFGIAKVLGSTLDLARTCIGTPYYMSPEICQEKRYNHKSDMWSLGCVLYEMTCLRHAFDGTNMRLLVMKICSQEPRPISARYSSGMRNLIAQLLKKDPHARPSTGAILRRPLIKDKIGRFLSEAQIKEEFSNGVSHGHQPSSSSSSSAVAAAAAASPNHPPGAGSAAPRWPFNAAGVSRPRPEAASPGQARRGRDGNDAGRAIAAGGVGGKVKVSQEAKAGDRRRRAAEEAEERRKAEPLARKREVRAAAAKERGQLAAVALNIAKSSHADRRPAAPKRPSSAEEDAAAARRRKQREARPPEERALDSKRVRERAEAARGALWIGGGKRPSPRRSSQRVGNEKDQAPRRPSAPSPPAAGADSVARGGRDDGRVFQRLQNVRGGGGAGGIGSPAEGGGVERAAQQPGRLGGEGCPGEVGSGVQPAGAAGADNMRMEMDEALDLARRRRAARAVFGPGFGAPGSDSDEPSAPCLEAKNGRSGLKVKSCSDSSSSVEQGLTAGPDHPADAKLSAEMREGPPLPPESRQVTDHHHHQQQDAPVGAKNDSARKPGMIPVTEGGVGDMDKDARQRPGQARQLKEVVSEIVPEIVAETVPPRVEHKKPRDDEEEKAGLSGRGEVAKGVDAGEEKGRARGPCRDSLNGIGGDVDDNVAEGGGDSEARSKIDLGVTDGWFQKFEAKMGAIKKQVGQIKSPPLSTPQRSGDGGRHGYASSRRNELDAVPLNFQTPPPRDHNNSPSSMMAAGNDDEKETAWPVDGGPPPVAQAQRLPCHSQEEQEKKQTTTSEAGSDRRRRDEERDVKSERSGGSNSPDVGGADGFTPPTEIEPGGGRLWWNSQQTKRLSAAAAAIEAAAAAVAAIPVNAPEDPRSPEPSGHSGGASEDDRAGNPLETPGGGGSDSTRARPAPAGIAGGVKVAMTPAQRGSGGRGARRAPLSTRSERKPPRHAAALAAELERHSESRRRKKPATGAGHSGGDVDGLGGSNTHTPSAKERGQALRAARDRERSQLRALIAQKRRKPIKKLKDGGGGGGGDEENLNGDAPRNELVEPLLAWSSPRNRVAATGGARPLATEPPPRRPERLRGMPPHGTVAPGGKAVGGDGVAGSVDASRRWRRPRNNNHSSRKQHDVGGDEADARKDPANRHQSLRDFIAESRRNRRTRRQSHDAGDEEDEISVVVAAAGPGRIGGLSAATPPDGESNVQVSEDGGEVAAAAGPRRNIGREFDDEDRAWEGAGAGEGGPENGQVGGERGRRGNVPKGGILELAEWGSVEDEKREQGGDTDRGSRQSSRSSSSSSSQRERLPETGAGDGEAVGAMEGVPPSLATYESQRSAAGMDGGGRAGQEEYARMLELMQKEVLELGDGASTDSGWGGSASSSGEEKRHGRERDENTYDDGERSTNSSGAGSSAGEGGASPVVSRPELAVFSFQRGAKGESDAALEAEDDSSSDPSAGARREATRSPCFLPSSEDAFFEYSGSGGEGLSGTTRGVQRTGGVGSSPAAGKATTRESGDPAVTSREDSEAKGGLDFSERRETVVDCGARSASLTDELRGVDFVDVPVDTWQRPPGVAKEPT
eukprot:g8387.t1